MIGILSDAHGNQPAFEKGLNLLERFGAEAFIFLGDGLGYFPHTEILDYIQSLGSNIRSLRGNHEDLILKKKFQGPHEPVYQHQAIVKSLTAGQLEMIDNWPSLRTLKCSAGTVSFMHGGPYDKTYEYVYPDTDLTVYDIKERFVFMGHTHRPFIRHCGKTVFVNVGSCGMPRDHGCLGAVALFDEEVGEVRIIRYDIQFSFEKVLRDSACLHPSILEVMNRRTDGFVGEYVE